MGAGKGNNPSRHSTRAPEILDWGCPDHIPFPLIRWFVVRGGMANWHSSCVSSVEDCRHGEVLSPPFCSNPLWGLRESLEYSGMLLGAWLRAGGKPMESKGSLAYCNWKQPYCHRFFGSKPLLCHALDWILWHPGFNFLVRFPDATNGFMSQIKFISTVTWNWNTTCPWVRPLCAWWNTKGQNCALHCWVLLKRPFNGNNWRKETNGCGYIQRCQMLWLICLCFVVMSSETMDCDWTVSKKSVMSLETMVCTICDSAWSLNWQTSYTTGDPQIGRSASKNT